MFGGKNVGKREDLFFFFFGLHSIIRGKLDVGRREDLFFCFWGLHSIIRGKLDVGRREGLIEMCFTCLTVNFKFLMITFKF